jgi:phage/plasmid-like protein (TIGR03299 family)
MSRIAWLELDDAVPVQQETPDAPVPAPTEIAPEAIRTVDREMNGSAIAAGSDGLTARAEGEVYSARSLARAADLDWQPVLQPLVTASGGAVPRKIGQAVTRSDTGATLGIVGERYHPVDHAILFDLADAVAKASQGGLRYANAGHRADGARPFVQMRMPGRAGRVDKETVLSLFTSHDGTLCLTGGLGSTIIVCRNTYAHALNEAKAGFKIRHTASADAMIAQAFDIARIAAEYDAAFSGDALSLMGKRFTDADMIKLSRVLLPGDSTKTVNMREKLVSAFSASPGAMPGTAWGAAQAVTYYTSHHAGSAESREETSIFGTGIGADLQASAWWILAGDEATTAQRLEQKLLRA